MAFYQALADPVLPETLRPEAVRVDKWNLPLVRPIAQIHALAFRAIPFYEALTEPVLPESLRPETVAVDKWDLPIVRPVQRLEFHSRAYLETYVLFEDLFVTEPAAPELSWWAQDVRPVQRTPFYIRAHLTDLTTFSDLFAAAVARRRGALMRKWRKL